MVGFALVRVRLLLLLVVERRQGPAGWTKMGGGWLVVVVLVLAKAKAKKGLKMGLPR